MALPHETAPYWAVLSWPGLRLSFVVLALQCGFDAPVHAEMTLLRRVMPTRFRPAFWNGLPLMRSSFDGELFGGIVAASRCQRFTLQIPLALIEILMLPTLDVARPSWSIVVWICWATSLAVLPSLNGTKTLSHTCGRPAWTVAFAKVL